MGNSPRSRDPQKKGKKSPNLRREGGKEGDWSAAKGRKGRDKRHLLTKLTKKKSGKRGWGLPKSFRTKRGSLGGGGKRKRKK